MTDPLVESVEELLKVLFLLMRFVQPEDVEELNQELEKLGIEEGFGARAKKALEEHSTLTPREIRMAKFLAGECVVALRLARLMLNGLRKQEYYDDDLQRAIADVDKAYQSIIATDGVISDFTEEEAKIIREAK